MRQLKTLLNRILVITMIFITLMFFFLRPPAEAAKLPKDGEFYYSGVTQANYVVTKGIFAWLLDALKGIVDFILGAIAMLFRMVVVGWTAFIEMMLTEVLEATMGMDIAIGNIDSTNLSSSTNSRNNVTVEAIVYNLVPIFNINLFRSLDEEMLRTGTGKDISTYVCARCEKKIDECHCTSSGANQCDCNLCQIRRFRENPDNKTAVDMVKESVISWYYVIRLIAIAGMLLVLLGIGIKMAISTIASEKALYKRMIVDWVVGFIILFTAHYMMIAMITVNETLVEIIRKSANTRGNQVAQSMGAEFGKTDKESSEIEISIYEAVRTRAYDAKLMNGTVGMVMYAALVFMAIKYSLIYLKRYLTIIALTLMAPGAGFAYALQKALSGKSKAFSNWLKEYFMNVIIQSVHALLYSAFVTMALILSLQSISGMIIALILLNFMTKADQLLRKIFKMSSEGSLLDNAESSGDMEKMKSNLNTAKSLYLGAKPAVSALAHSPISKAIAGTAKTIRNEAILGIARGKNFVENSDSKLAKGIRGAGEKAKDIGQSAVQGIANRANKNDNKKHRVAKALHKALQKSGLDSTQDEKLLAEMQGGKEKSEKEALMEAINASEDVKNARKNGKSEHDIQEEIKKAKEKWQEYYATKAREKRRQRLEGATPVGAVKNHLGQVFNVRNYYRTAKDAKGKIKLVRIGSKFGTKDKNKNIRSGLLSRMSGTFLWDKEKGMPVRMSVGDLISHQLSSEQLLGLSKEDKQSISEISKFIGTGMVGMASMMIGMGTFVTNPKLGMPFLAGGFAASSKLYGRNLRVSKYGTVEPQRYSFCRFSAASTQRIMEEIQSQYEEEKRDIDNIMKGAESSLKAQDQGKEAERKRIEKKEKELSASARELYSRINEQRPGIIRTQVGDRFFGGITAQFDRLADEQSVEVEKRKKEQTQVAIALVSDNLQQDYMKKMKELEESLRLGLNEVKVSEDTVISFGGSTEAIGNAKTIDMAIERSILAFSASKKELNVSNIDINDNTSKSEIKKSIEETLVSADILKGKKKLDDIIPNIDEKILDVKARLDKNNTDIEDSKSQKQTMTKVEELLLQETVKKYIADNQEIKSVSDIVSEEVLKQYKAALSEKIDTSLPEQRAKQQVEEVLSTLQERKKAKIGDVKKILSEAAETKDGDKDGKKKNEKQLLKEYRGASAGKGTSDIQELGLSDKQSEKVLELLLMQKKMKELNQKGIEEKMVPLTDTAMKRVKRAKKHLEISQTSDGSRRVDPTKTGDRKVEVNRRTDTTYGPVNDIISLINGENYF